MDKIFHNAQSRSYQKGQILLYQGEQSDKVFYISKGYVKIYDIAAQGNEKLILLLSPGDIFPIVWTFEGKKDLHYFYETFTDADLRVMSRDELLESNETSHEVTKTPSKILRYS